MESFTCWKLITQFFESNLEPQTCRLAMIQSLHSDEREDQRCLHVHVHSDNTSVQTC